MQDLEELNSQMAARLIVRTVQFVFTGYEISGKNRCSICNLTDCLFTCWRSDPVHRDRSAYMKIAVGIMDFLSPLPCNSDNCSGPAQRKRSREDSSPTPTTVNVAVEGRVFLLREGRTSDPDLPTAATPAGPAAVAASTKRHSSRPAVMGAQLDDLRLINISANIVQYSFLVVSLVIRVNCVYLVPS
jgi:hypothetical protein